VFTIEFNTNSKFCEFNILILNITKGKKSWWRWRGGSKGFNEKKKKEKLMKKK